MSALRWAPTPDPRVAQLKRAFAPTSGPAASDFAEVSQMTTVYTTTETRQDRMRSTMDAAAACERAVNDEYGAQITEGWSEVEVPRSTAEAGLEARVITASMPVASTGRVFPHSWGCVGRGPVLQCVSVWTLDRASTDRYLSEALAATAQGLAAADISA